MGLTDEYRQDVEEIEQSVENVISRQQASRAKQVLDSLLPLALLGVVFLFMTAFVIPVSSRMAMWINFLNWAVLVYFLTRLGIEFRLADSRNDFFHRHWLDLLLAIPAFSALREIRLVQLIGDIEIFSVEADAVVGSAALTRLGFAGKLTRISRLIRRSFGF